MYVITISNHKLEYVLSHTHTHTHTHIHTHIHTHSHTHSHIYTLDTRRHISDILPLTYCHHGYHRHKRHRTIVRWRPVNTLVPTSFARLQSLIYAGEKGDADYEEDKEE